jgi:hypothetical protein
VSEEAESATWLENWAERIDRSGFSPIALPLLHIAEAFGFLGSQALLIAQPLAADIVNETTYERAVALLDDRELLERLRQHLENREE